MKQPDNKDSRVKEKAIEDLYINEIKVPSRIKSAINIPLKKKAENGQNEEKQLSPRRIDDLIDSVRKEKIRRNETSQTSSNVRSLVTKYLDNDSACLSKKCSMRDVDNQLKERLEQERLEKLKKALRQRLKQKQSNVRWKTQRKASLIKQNQERQRIQNDLKFRQQEWRIEQKLLNMQKQMEKDFKHSINMEKIEMMRNARRRMMRSETRFLSQLEKESWRDSKFKQQNQVRIQSARKQLEYDALGLLTNRIKSTKTSIPNE